MKKTSGKVRTNNNPGRNEGDMCGNGVPVQIIYYVIDKIFSLFTRKKKEE